MCITHETGRPRVRWVGAARVTHTPRASRHVMMTMASSASSLPSAATVRGNANAPRSSSGSSSGASLILPRGNAAVRRAVAGPRIIVDGGAESAMRGLNEKRREVIEDMGSFASGELMGLLKDPETNWQPQDWLPDPSRDDFLDQVRRRFRSFVEAGTNLESRILNLHSFKLISSDATRAGLGLGLGCDVDDAKRGNKPLTRERRGGVLAWVVTRAIRGTRRGMLRRTIERND